MKTGPFLFEPKHHPCYGPAQEGHTHRDQQESYRKEFEADDRKKPEEARDEAQYSKR